MTFPLDTQRNLLYTDREILVKLPDLQRARDVFMKLFYLTMPLFWTLAEGLILIALRQGFLSFKGENRRQALFLFFSLFIFLALVVIRFKGENIMSGFMDMERRSARVIYNSTSWNFFCTIWVVLEGAIMIYVYRIYNILRVNLKGNGKSSFLQLRSKKAWGIPVLVISLLSLYSCYQYNLISVSMRFQFDLETIRMISLFYIRICGLFWIIFEWIVAVIGIKTYLLLKREGETGT